MIKKILKFLKLLIVFMCWSVVWLGLMRYVLIYIWNFDFISISHWRFVSSFWNANGTIKGLSDYMLFLTMLLTLVFWFLGAKRLYVVNYGELLLRPFKYFSTKQIEKYDSTNKHIVLKNLVVGEKMSIDDLIEEKIKEEDNKQLKKESENLRESISKKITERKGQ